MSNDIKKTIKNYAKKLEKENFPIAAIYLYDSYAKNTAKNYSDIDVAVISDKLKRNWDKNESLLWIYASKIDSRIEPIGFTKQEFEKSFSPLVYEIKKHGIRII